MELSVPRDWIHLPDFGKTTQQIMLPWSILPRKINWFLQQPIFPENMHPWWQRVVFQALDTLSATEKSWIAPLPIAYDANLPGYKI